MARVIKRIWQGLLSVVFLGRAAARDGDRRVAILLRLQDRQQLRWGHPAGLPPRHSGLHVLGQLPGGLCRQTQGWRG